MVIASAILSTKEFKGKTWISAFRVIDDCKNRARECCSKFALQSYAELLQSKPIGINILTEDQHMYILQASEEVSSDIQKPVVK